LISIVKQAYINHTELEICIAKSCSYGQLHIMLVTG